MLGETELELMGITNTDHIKLILQKVKHLPLNAPVSGEYNSF